MNKIKEKLLKEIKSMEEAKSLRDSCYDYFYKKFGDSWEEKFYEKHLKDLKSDCAYLNLKLKLKQHEETSKAKDEKFINLLDKLIKKIENADEQIEFDEWETFMIFNIQEIKQRIKEK